MRRRIWTWICAASAAAAALSSLATGERVPAAHGAATLTLDDIGARLAPRSSSWEAGDTPYVHLEIENRGERVLRVPRSPTLVELEIDGRRARARGESETPYLGALSPGRVTPWVALELDVFFITERDGREVWRPEVLSAGVHTVRAKVVVDSLEDGTRSEVMTEPVTVEIYPSPEASDDSEAASGASRERELRRRLTWRSLPEPKLGLYLVRGSCEEKLSSSTDLAALDLESVPVIDENDIVGYDWETHTMELTPAGIARLPSPGVFGVYFVVVAEGERCYAAAFWTPLSSSLPKVPMCYPPRGALAAFSRAGPNRMMMASSPFEDEDDPRGDDRVRGVLEALGKLR